MCGAPATAPPQAGQHAARRPIYDRETIRFARAVLTRPAPFTIVLLIANIFVFLLTLLSSGGENNPLFNFVLVAYGAKMNALINSGEWWRFVTPIFLHGGILHLLMNMYGLWVLGPYVERLYGSAKFVVFWVLTGVAGVVASYLTVRPNMQLNAVSRFLFKNGDPVSVGASGALFGLIGVLFVFGIKFRHELPDGFKRAFGTGMLPTILLNVFIGFTIPVIDNAAHMGGLLAGAALALVVGYKRPGESSGIALFWHILQVAALLLVVVSFTMVALRFQGPRPALRNLSSHTLLNGDSADLGAYLKALNAGTEAFYHALSEWDAGAVDQPIKDLESAPGLDEKAGAMRDELKSLLERARDLAKTPLEQRRKARTLAQQKELLKDFEAWVEKRDQWIKTDGEKYGIELVAPKTPPEKQDGQEPDKNGQDNK